MTHLFAPIVKLASPDGQPDVILSRHVAQDLLPGWGGKVPLLQEQRFTKLGNGAAIMSADMPSASADGMSANADAPAV